MRLRAAVAPLGALLLSIALLALIVLALGASPLTVFVALVEGAFGDWLAATDTLVVRDGKILVQTFAAKVTRKP